MYQFYIDEAVELLNDNSGVIAALSPFLAYYLGMITLKKADKKKRKEFRKELEFLLLNEIFFNLDVVSRLENTFNKNLTIENNNLYIPTKAPRTEIIEKYVEYDIISSLDKSQRGKVLNIYAQLLQLKKEYYMWRELISKNPELKLESPIVFEQLSIPMANIIPSVLNNMVNLWINLVLEIGNKSEYGAIKEINSLMRKQIKEKKWISGFYKSSEHLLDPEINKYHVVICWKNDLDAKSDKEIIEISSFIPKEGY